MLDQYCVACHNQNLRTAGLALDEADVDDVSSDPEIWEKVARKVRTGQMPPANMPTPDSEAATAFASHLEAELDRLAAAHPNPGRVAVHRLNRAEYANAVRDLLAVEVDPQTVLVPDGTDQFGFDNIAAALTVSPALLESYMSSARKISRLAVGDTDIVPVQETYDVPGSTRQENRMSDELPFNSRGGIAVRHRFPVDGEYSISIRLRRQLYGYIQGLGRPHQMEVRLNRERIALFTVGGDAPAGRAPATWAGSIAGNPEWELYMHEADANLQVRFPARAGVASVGVSFIKDIVESEEIPRPPAIGFGLAVNERFDDHPSVDKVIIGGPYSPTSAGETASRRKIFLCRPEKSSDEVACAKQILSALARRAYRRPLTDRDVERLLGFYSRGQQQGGFEAGIRLAIQRVLTDPNFLFRVERAPAEAAAGKVYRLTDLELASRLSFFLWSSIPDEELLDLASEGKLSDPGVLEQQIRRMISDARSTALVKNFAAAWLQLRKLRDAKPDPNIFPEFDENLRTAFETETELFLESLMRADRSVSDALTADYTYLNERLARHYRVPNVYGNHFRRIQLNQGERGGLLGQGSILLVTSYPNRTSPVIRGKFLLDNILGMPPPPPPPDVPGLKESDPNGRPTSVRQRLEEHRRNPACASCHVRMDPLGFALENYDAIGRWRTESDGVPVDSSASMPDGTTFEGVAGLRGLLEDRRELFVDVFTERLLIYALGRELEYYDLPVIRDIKREAAGDGYRWSAIISGIVNSPPFQMSVVPDASSDEVAARMPEERRQGSRQ